MTTYEAIKSSSGCMVLQIGSRMRGTHAPDSDHDYLCIFDDDKLPNRIRLTVGKEHYSITSRTRFQHKLDRNDLHAIEIYLTHSDKLSGFRCDIDHKKLARSREFMEAFTNDKGSLLERAGHSSKASEYNSHFNAVFKTVELMLASGELCEQSTCHERPVMPEPKSVTDCQHRGDELRREQCPSCSGFVQVKVFGCSIHNECTISKQINDLKNCSTCSDKQPQG